MITDVIVVHNDPEVEKRIAEAKCKINPFIQFHAEYTKEGKANGYKVKNTYAAKLSPFILLLDKGTPIKALYTEADPDVVGTLINILNIVDNAVI